MKWFVGCVGRFECRIRCPLKSGNEQPAGASVLYGRFSPQGSVPGGSGVGLNHAGTAILGLFTCLSYVPIYACARFLRFAVKLTAMRAIVDGPPCD
jgi:hypothetical protein